jgi:hypothetical protein
MYKRYFSSLMLSEQDDTLATPLQQITKLMSYKSPINSSIKNNFIICIFYVIFSFLESLKNLLI